MLGKGFKLDEVLEEMGMVVEGSARQKPLISFQRNLM